MNSRPLRWLIVSPRTTPYDAIVRMIALSTFSMFPWKMFLAAREGIESGSDASQADRPAITIGIGGADVLGLSQ